MSFSIAQSVEADVKNPVFFDIWSNQGLEKIHVRHNANTTRCFILVGKYRSASYVCFERYGKRNYISIDLYTLLHLEATNNTKHVKLHAIRISALRNFQTSVWAFILHMRTKTAINP